MLIKKPVGITSYGAYLPSLAIRAETIARSQGRADESVYQNLAVAQKTVPDFDEDSTTLATAAAYQALSRLRGKANIGALFIGSESHPYAVKPTGTMVKTALGLPDQMSLVDMQFACKAGTQAVQTGIAHVLSDLAPEALAIGTDTAQSRPGDVLEFTASAGAAAFVLGRQKILARLLATRSLASDTPDFWRRPRENYPQHAGRFSGEPAYFQHVLANARAIMEECQLDVNDFKYVIFHTPNAKFPQLVAQKLGFSPEQLAPGLIVKQIGNTYAAAVPLALAAVLDVAQTGDKILTVSYGSGSGSDAFVWEATAGLVSARKKFKNLISEQISKLKVINYEDYRSRTRQH